MVRARLWMRHILAGALLSLPMPASLAADELVGAAPVRLEFARGHNVRMGLVIGALPRPFGGQLVLLPDRAIYGSDLRYPKAIKSVGSLVEREGQILDLPAIELPPSADSVRSLHAVWVPFGRANGTAACIGRVRVGDATRIATIPAAGAREASPVAGQVLQVDGDRFLVSVEQGVMFGDPVFVDARVSPRWRALGVVTSAAGPGRAWVVSLRAIFRSMPPESSWALQPRGLCDPALGDIDRLQRRLRIMRIMA